MLMEENKERKIEIVRSREKRERKKEQLVFTIVCFLHSKNTTILSMNLDKSSWISS